VFFRVLLGRLPAFRTRRFHLRFGLGKQRRCSDVSMEVTADLRWRCVPRKKSTESILEFSALGSIVVRRCVVYSNETLDLAHILLYLARLLSPGPDSVSRVSRKSAPHQRSLNATPYVALCAALLTGSVRRLPSTRRRCHYQLGIGTWKIFFCWGPSLRILATAVHHVWRIYEVCSLIFCRY
jgi:hypothetical protein